MENLGKSFMMVIEPLNFDLRQQKVFYSDFGFIIVSESEFFRDSIIKLCQECHKIRQKGFGPKLITSIRKRMKEFVRKSFRTERDLLELVALLFDITYYTAVSHDKDAHLRKFTTIMGASPKYFGYFGSRDYNSLKILEKIQKKIERSEDMKGTGSYFDILQIIN